MSKRHMTLVELLVVIFIIALLAGLLLPTLASSQNKAKGIYCVQNLKQLALAMNSYASDSSGLFPRYNYAMGSGPYWFGYGNGGGYYDLTRNQILGDYLSNCAAVVVCPTVRGFIPDLRAADATGYGYNGCWLGGYNGLPTPKMSMLRHPSATIAFADAAAAPMGTYTYSQMLWPKRRPGETVSHLVKTFHFRHGRTSSAAWVDGHVSAEKLSGLREASFHGGDIGDIIHAADNAIFDLD